MTVAKETEAEIRRLFFAEHWKEGTIVAQLGVHEDVVARVLGPHGPEPKGKPPRPCMLDPYQGFVCDTLERYPTVVATRIYDMISERGYTGSIRTLRRFVLDHRPTPACEVYLRIETLAGEQSQIDWAHVGKIRVQGGVRPLYCFVLLLRHSRAMWAELVLEQTTVSLFRSLVRAAQYFGGVTREWLFDNPKSIVAARVGSAIRFQEELVELSSRLHVALRAARIRTPTDKGGVERAIRYLKTRFFPARTIPSLESGNAALWQFLETVAMRRQHPAQKDRTVAEVFTEEKERLLPLPDAAIPPDLVTSAPSDKTAFVCFDGEHARAWGKNLTLEVPEHRAALLARKPGAHDGKGRDRLRAEVPRIDELLRLWLEDGRYVGSLIGRTCKLLDLYGRALLAAAVEALLAKGSHDYGALAILCEKQRTRPRRVLPLDLASHVVDRDVIPHDLGAYDDDDDDQ